MIYMFKVAEVTCNIIITTIIYYYYSKLVATIFIMTTVYLMVDMN